MENLLGALLANAILVSLLALLVLGVEISVRRPALVHWLWVLLLIKLLTPPFVPISLGADPDPQPAAEAAISSRVGSTPSQAVAAPLPVPSSRNSSREPAREDRSYPEPVQPMVFNVAQWVPLSWPMMTAATWLSVSAVWLLWSLYLLVRASRWLGDATLAAEPLQQRARELAARIGITERRVPGVRMVPGAMSPLLWAIGGRPRLLVPVELWDQLDTVKRDALLVHELAHLRRRDHWVRVLELAVTSLYWWCPVVWWVRRTLHDAEERCCDAWVVWALPGAARAYAAALLDTVDFLAESPARLPLGSSGLWRIRQLKGRLASIMRGGVPTGLSRSGTAAVFGLAVVMVPLKPPIFSARTYRVTDLGSLGGPTSYPQRINNRGQVVGYSMIRSGEYHAFRTAPNRSIDPAADAIGGPYGGPAWYQTNSPGGSPDPQGALAGGPHGGFYCHQ